MNVIFLILLLISPAVFAAQESCQSLAALLAESQSGQSASKSTETFFDLVRHLTKEKNALSSETLTEMAAQESLPNPMDYTSESLSAEDHHVFAKAFSSLKNIQWELVREKVAELGAEGSQTEAHKSAAKADTHWVFAAVPLNEKFDIPNRKFDGGFIDENGKLTLYEGFGINGKGNSFLYEVKDKSLLGLGNFLGYGDATLDVNLFISSRGEAFAISNSPDKIIIHRARESAYISFRFGSEMFFKQEFEKLDTVKASIFENSEGQLEVVNMGLIKATGFVKPEVRFYRENLETKKVTRLNLPPASYSLQKLADGRVVAIGATPESGDSEIVVTEMSEPAKVLFKIKKPQDAGVYFSPHCRILETKSGQYFMVALSHSGNYIFDLSTGEILKLNPFYNEFRDIDAFEEKENGDLSILTSEGRSTSLLSVDFKNKQVKVNQAHVEIGYPSHEQFLRLKNRDLTYIKYNNGKEHFLYIFNITQGTIQKLDLHFPHLGAQILTKQEDNGRLVSYFIDDSGHSLRAYQIYGPLDEGATK